MFRLEVVSVVHWDSKVLFTLYRIEELQREPLKVICALQIIVPSLYPGHLRYLRSPILVGDWEPDGGAA